MTIEQKSQAIVGIDPKTRRVVEVAANTRESQLEMIDGGLILVPTSFETARTAFGDVVNDIYERFCK